MSRLEAMMSRLGRFGPRSSFAHHLKAKFHDSVLDNRAMISDCLGQGWANYGPRAACDPRDRFRQPAGTCREINLVPY